MKTFFTLLLLFIGLPFTGRDRSDVVSSSMIATDGSVSAWNC